MDITLALPPLKPGEQPPAVCPHCAGLRDIEGDAAVTSYGCGAFYILMSTPGGDTASWIAHRDCHAPRPSAVLRALAMSIDVEHKSAECDPAYNGSFLAADLIGAVIDAWEAQ